MEVMDQILLASRGRTRLCVIAGFNSLTLRTLDARESHLAPAEVIKGRGSGGFSGKGSHRNMNHSDWSNELGVESVMILKAII